jgi:hypothetical protein
MTTSFKKIEVDAEVDPVSRAQEKRIAELKNFIAFMARTSSKDQVFVRMCNEILAKSYNRRGDSDYREVDPALERTAELEHFIAFVASTSKDPVYVRMCNEILSKGLEHKKRKKTQPTQMVLPFA